MLLYSHKKTNIMDYTADGNWSYSKMVNGKSLAEHANDMNVYMEKLNSWSRTSIAIGTWGIDINVSRIGHAIETTTIESPLEDVAKAVHDGWKTCFNFWLHNEPWKINSNYKPPGKSLTSRDKLKRATLSFDMLDDYQKTICMQMATYIKQECMENP